MINLILSFIAISQQFKLKHADKGSYICEGTSGSKKPLSTCPDASSGTEWRIERKPNGQGLVFPTSDSNVWDIAEAARVEVKVKHGKANQQFSIVYISPDKYALVSTGRCLAFEDPFHFMRPCDYSINQLYTIVYNDSEANELTETKTLSNNSSAPSIDYAVVDTLQKMIDDNKEIARHIAYTHDHDGHGHRSHHHHHSHSHDNLKTHRRRKEEGPYLLDFVNNN